MSLNATVARVTDRIIDRSRPLRRPYLDRMRKAREEGQKRAHLACGNQAHAYAAMTDAEKAKIRQQFATGEVGRDKLMESEMASYHGPGTCTFYGTANTNQMLMEFMGLHLPGASFVNPGTPLRDALTVEGAKRALAISALGNQYTPVCDVLDERAFVNGIVGLNATGGSTNLLIHLIAMARAAGILLDWEDFA